MLLAGEKRQRDNTKMITFSNHQSETYKSFKCRLVSSHFIYAASWNTHHIMYIHMKIEQK
jgi:hypothetical protein